MEKPQRKTTNRYRSQRVINTPMVEIKATEISESVEVVTTATDLESALDEVERLWDEVEVDYVAAIPIREAFLMRDYMIYAPEQSVGPYRSVGEYLDRYKRFSRIEQLGGELVGIRLDNARCPEDSHDLRIAKGVVKYPFDQTIT